MKKFMFLIVIGSILRLVHVWMCAEGFDQMQGFFVIIAAFALGVVSGVFNDD